MLRIQEKILLFSIRTRKDEKAFEKLISSHTVALKRFFVIKLPRQEDADDAFSTTLLRVWNYIKSSEVESVSGLVFTIARGVVAEFYRSRKIETVSIEGHEESVVDSVEGLENYIDVEIIKQKVKELNDEQQLAFELKFLEGLTVREVAERIQKSESATRVMLHRLIKKMRNELSKKCDQ